MKILVTGAGGFTGRHFVERARAAGHATVPLQVDLTRGEEVAAALTGLDFDAVVHLAAISFVGHADDKAFYDVNLFGTLNLLEAVQKRGEPMRKVLVASSANVYGNCEQSPIAESQPPAPVNHYATSKLAMECMARARAGNLPLILTRPFNYTGRGQAGHFVIPKLVEHFKRKAPTISLGNIHVEREYNDVRFLCDAYLALLQAEDALGTFNVCTGRLWSLSAVMEKLQAITGHALKVETDPRLVRSNEVHKLCGDPAKLRQTIGGVADYALEDTLRWMLADAE